MTVDDVWAAMHVVQPGAASTDDSICPCSLSALPTDGQPIPSDVAHPYWTIGDTQGASIGVTAPGGKPILVRDCEGVTAVLTVDPGFNTPQIADANVAIIQLADGRPHYITATISSASAGDYLADSCAGPTPYALPADFLSGPGQYLSSSAPCRRSTSGRISSFRCRSPGRWPRPQGSRYAAAVTSPRDRALSFPFPTSPRPSLPDCWTSRCFPRSCRMGRPRCSETGSSSTSRIDRRQFR